MAGGVPTISAPLAYRSAQRNGVCRQVCAAIASNRREPLHLLDLSENGIGLGALRQFDTCQLDSCPIQVSSATPPHVALSFQSCTGVIVWARPIVPHGVLAAAAVAGWCGSRLGCPTAL